MEPEIEAGPRPPNVPLLRALWSRLDAIWSLLKGSWGVLGCFDLLRVAESLRTELVDSSGGRPGALTVSCSHMDSRAILRLDQGVQGPVALRWRLLKWVSGAWG